MKRTGRNPAPLALLLVVLASKCDITAGESAGLQGFFGGGRYVAIILAALGVLVLGRWSQLARDARRSSDASTVAHRIGGAS